MDKLRARLREETEKWSNPHDLEVEVCEVDDLDLVYIRIFGKYGEAEPYEEAWNLLIGFLKENQALSEDTRFIGLSFDDPNVTHPDQCRFYARFGREGDYSIRDVRYDSFAERKICGLYLKR